MGILTLFAPGSSNEISSSRSALGLLDGLRQSGGLFFSLLAD
jgi:hypothetical protein